MSDTIDCPFCNPQERVLLENGQAQAILSDPRKVPGHFLVMPKRHVEKPWGADRNRADKHFCFDC